MSHKAVKSTSNRNGGWGEVPNWGGTNIINRED